MKICKCKDPYPMKMLKISKIAPENKNVTSFYFNHVLNSKPGQFVMAWLPGVGEKPMSIAMDNGKEFALSIAAVGDFSRSISKAKVGDYIGIRGPLGTYFNLSGKKIALAGGGYGSGPMASLAEHAIATGMRPENIHLIIGASTKDLLLFEKRLEGTGVNVHITTDDGSYGQKCTVIDVLGKLKVDKIDKIYSVGPELMMKSVYDFSVEQNIDCEISLERYMKCGIGVCGSCVVDPLGIRMCIEGPVIGKELISKISEFGVYHRDASGKKVSY